MIWHDLECGAYEQDLALWLTLAAQYVPGQAVLDVGAGTGRVTLALARAGHSVVALDRDAELLAELERRAGGLPVETVCADAREFAAAGTRVSADASCRCRRSSCSAAPAGQAAFLRCAAAHLVPGGVLAVAIADAEDFEEFEWHDGDRRRCPTSRSRRDASTSASRPRSGARPTRSCSSDAARSSTARGASDRDRGPDRAGHRSARRVCRRPASGPASPHRRARDPADTTSTSAARW